MLKKRYINKDDFKKYKTCSKVSLINSTIENKKKFYNLVEKNKISYFKFDFNKKEISETKSDKSFNCKNVADGIYVGSKAKEYFKNNQKNNCKDFEKYSQKEAIKKTQEYIKDDNYNVLFEPVFVYNNLITRCDVLKRFLDGWEIIEVKAVTKIDREHLYDIYFQYYILKNLGIKIYNLNLMYLNNKYELEDQLDLSFLFLINNSILKNLKNPDTKKSEKIDVPIKEEADNYLTKKFPKDLKKLNSLLFNKDIDFDKYMLNQYCDNGESNYCFHVIEYIPPKDTIFNLYQLRIDKKIKFFYDENILLLNDIDLEKDYFHPFSTNQKTQILSVQNKHALINSKNIDIINNTLKEYKYPIYMYDFETCAPAIPKFNFSNSYQQIPFQYSMHVLLNENFNYKTSKNITHSYYLSNGEKDPRIGLIYSLTKNSSLDGVYVAYNKSFEIGVIKKLLEFIEYDLKTENNLLENHEKLIIKLKYIMNNTLDLMDFFTLKSGNEKNDKKHFVIYKNTFNGSLSIKNTLPAFDNNFSYKHLKIQKGDIASENFYRRIYNDISLKTWKKEFRPHMIKYCNQDTLGMVVLFEKILELLKQNKL